LVEQSIRNRQVIGSSPIVGSITFSPQQVSSIVIAKMREASLPPQLISKKWHDSEAEEFTMDSR
jgi:hypothetical protein